MASVVSMLEDGFERLLAGKNDVKSPGQGQRLRAATPADTHGTANVPATLVIDAGLKREPLRG